MSAAISPSITAAAERIPYTNAAEAHQLMTTALERFLRLIDDPRPARRVTRDRGPMVTGSRAGTLW